MFNFNTFSGSQLRVNSDIHGELYQENRGGGTMHGIYRRRSDERCLRYANVTLTDGNTNAGDTKTLQ